MRSSIGTLTALAVLVIVSASCSGAVAEGESAGQATGAYAQLVADLEAGGAQVEAGGTVSHVFFVPEGQVIKVNAQDVQVFEFATEDEAESATSLISPDGSSIGTTMVTWIAAPHFYHKGTLIVLYVGEDATALDALEGALGSQIAGR